MMPWDGDDSYFQKVTGIPPHVVQLSKTEEVIQNVKKVVPAMQRILEDQLDSRAYGGTISEGRVRSIVQESISDQLKPIQEGINRIEAGRVGAGVNGGRLQGDGSDPAMARYGGMKFFNGKNRRVPPTFRFPDSHGSNLYQQWFIGSEPLHTPPLRMLEHDDVDFLVRGVKTLSDVRAFVKMINDKAKRLNLYVDEPNPEECLRVYNACRNVFLIPTTTKKGRNRNMAGLKWSSMMRLHSDELKRRREESGGAAQPRRVRRRPNRDTILRRREARGLVDGNTQRRRNNNGIRGGRQVRRQAPAALAGQGEFATAFGGAPIPPAAMTVDVNEIARIRQAEALARRTQEAAAAADADGNLLHIGRGAPGAPSARNPGFPQHLAESIGQTALI